MGKLVELPEAYARWLLDVAEDFAPMTQKNLHLIEQVREWLRLQQ